MAEIRNNNTRAVVKRKAESEHLQQGKFYALVIGVSTYKHFPSLEFPVKDAQKIERILSTRYTFSKEDITFLENPTRNNILDTLDGFEQILQKEDSLLIFYAGHGHWDEKRNQGYWLPRDAKIKAKSAWIANATLQGYLLAYDCQHVLVISDSCFSGALLMNRSATAIEDASKDFQVLYSARSRKAITSGVKEEVPDRSVFFKELNNFLKRNKQPFLSASELYAGIRNKVIIESRVNQKPQFGAIDEAGDKGGDFIFIKKGGTNALTIKKLSPFDELMKNPRIKDRLTALRKQLTRDIPTKSLTGNLLVASWNILELGGDKYGERTEEAIAYIATIISRFDIVAIQEIYGDFTILDKVKYYLGEHWEYIYSDTSLGFGGNDYRLGYFFDKRKAVQGGIISDLILPSIRSRDEQGHFQYKPAVQLLRPPFNCGFKIEDKRLILCNIHLVFGQRQTKAERLAELQSVLDFWKRRTSINTVWSKNVVLLGTLQTAKLSAKELYMIAKSGVFKQISSLKVGSNFTKTRHYNQMAFHLGDANLSLTNQGGAFDFFESVFRLEDVDTYRSMIKRTHFVNKHGEKREF
ncbi:MAG: hypothetical protein AB8G86_20405, partial [Saprospiraceae bacterium]